MNKNFEESTGIPDRSRLAYSVSDLTSILPISRANAYALVHSEGFPAVLIGHRILIPASGLERWLEEHTLYRSGEKDVVA